MNDRERIEALSIQLIHCQDDLEIMRSRVVHRLKRELTLLESGLDALRRDPPKVHVMDDHADRVIHALKQELITLNRNPT